MVRWTKIVVGVDGSPSSRSALEWAGDVAEQHGSELVAVMAWLRTPPPPSGPTSSVTEHGPSDHGEAARTVLLDTIRDVLGDDPPVLVQPQIKEGHAAETLIDLSGDANLLVVGSRGYGGFAGMLLGSVSQHVSAHAKCTVAVVR